MLGSRLPRSLSNLAGRTFSVRWRKVKSSIDGEEAEKKKRSKIGKSRKKENKKKRKEVEKKKSRKKKHEGR